MVQLFNSKQQLRKWAKDIRSNLNMPALSKIFVQKLKQTDEYKNSKDIMIFYPLKDEVNLLPLLEDSTKSFYLPKIDGENLLCCRYDKDTPLFESCFRTMEPVGKPEDVVRLDLIIVPALACDRLNYRLGYGKGYYDRFLGVNNKNNILSKTIVCIPKELIVETVFHNEFDIPVDTIITQD